jgi:uncharacterized protein (DUF1800 family)
MVGLSRQFKVKYGNEKILFALQKQLGQVLFFPPNVAGWPGSKNWIDSSTLILRMRLPSLILNNGEIENDNPKSADHDEMHEATAEQVNQKSDTMLNWVDILSVHQGMNIETLSKCFLVKQPSAKILNAINTEATFDVKEQIIKLVSLPEYNLC